MKSGFFPTELFDRSQPKIKGPNHPGQFRPLGFKDSRKTQELCTAYSGTKFNGLPTSKDVEANIPLKNYKDECRQHMICWQLHPFTFLIYLE